MLIDTHCHLDFPEFDKDRELVIRAAEENGVDCIINIGSSLAGSINSVALSKKYPQIFAVVGCHPHDAKDFSEEDFKAVAALAGNEKVVAIGEIGLDYYRNLSPQDKQRDLFIRFIHLAKELDLPAVIHSRDADSDTLDIIKTNGLKKAVVHCFSSGEHFLKEVLDLGFYVSFTCNITYKKAQRLRDIVKIAPVERVFLETDAPYLPAEGYRGKRNEPWFVRILAQEIARIKGISFDEVSRVTTENAKRFFKISYGSGMSMRGNPGM